jgi:tetratricopeptide (TPR) repeat protein
MIALILQIAVLVVNQGVDEISPQRFVREAEGFIAAAQQLERDGGSHTALAVLLADGAEKYRQAGFYDKAETFYRRALALLRPEPTSQHEVVAVLNNLGTLYREIGSYERSLACYKEAQAFIGKGVSAEDALNGTILNGLASIAVIKGDVSGARKYLQRSLHIREAALGPEHLEVAETLNNIGVLEWNAHHYTVAESMLWRVLAISEKQLGPAHPDVAAALTNLGVFYKTQRNYPEAEKLLRRALDINMKMLPPSHPNVARGHLRLAEVLMDEHRSSEAETLFKRALDLNTERPHRVETEDAIMLEEYGNALRSNGKPTDADVAEGRARSIRSELKYLFKP